MFLNLNGIFACVPQRRYSVIPCGVVALEEDSFTDGRAILQAIIDRGKKLHIFSSTEGVYIRNGHAGLLSTQYLMLVQLCEKRFTCHLQIKAVLWLKQSINYYASCRHDL